MSASRQRLLACAAAGAVALVAPAAVATRATAALPVRIVSHRVVSKTPALSRSRTVVSSVIGVSTAVSRRIAADMNARTLAFVTPPKGVVGPFDLVDTVTLVRADRHYLTLDQNTYDYSGGANGESAHLPVTYTRGTAAVMTLHTFAAKQQEAALLRALSARSRRALAARGIDPLFYTDGTAPTYENFAQFEPLPSGWLIEFPQSQVASHADGPITVLVPWSALTGLIGVPLPS